MGIQFADDFSRYGVNGPSITAMQDGLPYNNWASRCIPDPDPIIAAAGGRCIEINSGNDNNPLLATRVALPTPTTNTVGVCARYWVTNFGLGDTRQALAAFSTIAVGQLAWLYVEPNGALTIARGNLTPIATTGGPVISTNTWNHIETAYNGTTGAIEVRVNGIVVLTGVSADLGSIAFVHFTQRLGPLPGFPPYVKDLVIWDGTGATNNDFLGSVVCRRLKPNVDSTLGGWVPSTGATGFNLLAKNAVDDTTYLSADDTPPAAMRFGFEDTPVDITSVRALVRVVRAKKIDGGDGNLQTALISGASTTLGADRPITPTFAYWFDVSQIDPATGSPWLPVAVDAVIGQVDRTA